MATGAPADVADHIRRIRAARGLTQAELGALLGVSNVTVNRWERGRTRPTARAWQRVRDLDAHGASAGAPSDSLDSASAIARAGALPNPLTSFVGRTREIAAVAAVLGDQRLVSLTGPGGCGKTRLAIAVAAAVRHRFSDGVWWVDLGSLADASLVPEVVARALDANQPAARSPVARLTAACQGRQLLLLLDNCEHVLAACVTLLASLLAAVPEIKVLATSRAPLELPGETIWPVPPLSLPRREASGARREADDLPHVSDAVQLFVDRARTRRPEFALTERTAPQIVDVCRAVDGLPLAIELAAARAAVLSMEQIAARLADRFRLLRNTRDRPTVPPRQQTLSAAVDWSFDLLTEPERRLFTRLAIFPGRFDLDAVEAIGDAGRSPFERGDTPSVLDLLDRLVAQSLVVAEAAADEIGPMRYRLLATLRAYGWERLAAAGEFDAVADRHATYFRALAERAVVALRGVDQAQWLDRLDDEHDNLRAAIAWLIERDAATAAVRLAVDLERFWNVRGYHIEGHTWLVRSLALVSDGPSPERIEANLAAGTLAQPLGNYEEAIARFETALSDGRALGDQRAEAAALDALGVMARRQGDFPRAVALHEMALAIYRQLDDEPGVLETLITLGTAAAFKTDFDLADRCFQEGLALAHRRGDRLAEKTLWNDLGDLAQRRGDPAAAIDPFERSLEVARELGNRDGIAAALVNLAEVRASFGEVDRAIGLVAEGVQLLRESGNRAFLAAALYVLGRILSARGDHDRALATMREALAGYRRLGDASGIAHSLEALAWLTIEAGDAAVGARWLGAAAMAREALSVPVYDATAHARAERLASGSLGDAAFAELQTAGRSEPVEAILTEALWVPSRRVTTTRSSAGERQRAAQALTARQREVLVLVAAGRSNREIAEALAVSPRTVDHHLTAIYSILGVDRRAGAIAYALASGLVEHSEAMPGAADLLPLPSSGRWVD